MEQLSTPVTSEVRITLDCNVKALTHSDTRRSQAPLHACSRLTPTAAVVFAVLDESRGAPAGIELRVPAPSREQWVEVFGEEGENPHLPRTEWRDELQGEETAEQDYWAWVVASYPTVWGVNCDGIAREPIGRPLPAGLCRGRPSRGR